MKVIPPSQANSTTPVTEVTAEDMVDLIYRFTKVAHGRSEEINDDIDAYNGRMNKVYLSQPYPGQDPVHIIFMGGGVLMLTGNDAYIWNSHDQECGDYDSFISENSYIEQLDARVILGVTQ